MEYSKGREKRNKMSLERKERANMKYPGHGKELSFAYTSFQLSIKYLCSNIKYTVSI